MITSCLQDHGAKPARAGGGCFGTGTSRTVQGGALLDPLQYCWPLHNQLEGGGEQSALAFQVGEKFEGLLALQGQVCSASIQPPRYERPCPFLDLITGQQNGSLSGAWEMASRLVWTIAVEGFSTTPESLGFSLPSLHFCIPPSPALHCLFLPAYLPLTL